MPSEIISTGIGLSPPGGEEPELSDELAGPQVECRRCVVPPVLHGQRLDKALVALAPEFSRSWLQQLIADGAVRRGGAAVVKPAARVAAGECIEIELRPPQQAMAFVPQAMPLDIAYEDEHLLVVRKPAGLVVHPAAGHWSGTLLNGLLAHHGGAARLPRAGIVHRLDKDTSGLMVVGKTPEAVAALVRAIAAREVQRRYLALVHGHWQAADVLDIDGSIGRDPRNRLRMALVSDGKPARTTVARLDGNAQATLLACRLHTGRTHQIRVHLSARGHPLVGDALYGGRPAWGLARQALHAARLDLSHPVTGEALAFEWPPAADLASAIAAAGLRYNGLWPV